MVMMIKAAMKAEAEKVLEKTGEFYEVYTDGTASVDGFFTAEELEAIACLIRLEVKQCTKDT